MAANREMFAEQVDRHERTWAAWAQAFEQAGIRPNSGGPILPRTVRMTWYLVRRSHSMTVAPARKGGWLARN